MPTPGFYEFEFDLPDALLSSLVKIFDGMDGAPLLPVNVSELPEAQGVYQLLLGGEVVYIGKTDAEAGLKNRLGRHAYSIQHRLNLDTEKVTFKAVRVFVFTAMDLETQLISHYGSSAWNFSGFGSNDPGRNRDNTRLKTEGFDATYPIDIDRQLDIEWPEHPTAAQIVTRLKAELPYTLRYELRTGGRKIHPDFEAAQVTLSAGRYTVRTLVEAVIQALPAGWQATALPSRVIIYQETTEYIFGKVIARKPA
jgi:Eco29kI restriction endonuclease